MAEIVGGAPWFRTISFAIVIVITDSRLIVNSMAVENVDCRLRVLPLRLPCCGGSISAKAHYIAVIVDWIASAIDDVAEADHHLDVQRGLMANDPIRLVLKDVGILAVVILCVGKQNDGKIWVSL